MNNINKLFFVLLLGSSISNAIYEDDEQGCCRRNCWTAMYCVVTSCIYGCNYVQEHTKCFRGLELKQSDHVPNMLYLRYKKQIASGVIK